jgi:HK97 family phage prohead protease
MRKHLDVPFEVKVLDDTDQEGVFEGYGATFGNEDLGRDIIAKGAFKKTLGETRKLKRLPRMLWMHKSDEPIGVWTEMREDDTGLYVKGKLATTQRGRDTLELVRMGAVDGLSIGFQTVNAKMDDKTGARTLTEVRLFEVSPVAFPMNPEARVTAVKAAEEFETMSEREFEQLLRDAGLPKAFATAVTLHGFKKASADLRDAGGRVSDLRPPTSSLVSAFANRSKWRAGSGPSCTDAALCPGASATVSCRAESARR